jgi:hypothetical protein
LKVEELEKKVEELEKRLNLAADKEEIKKLQYHYIYSLIGHKWDEIADCFTENAEMDKGFEMIRGKAAIMKEFKEEISKSHTGKEGLFVVHPIINVDGDKATGKFLSYFMHVRSANQDPMLHWMQGVYNCTYVKENNKWKISLFYWRPRLRYKQSEMECLDCDLI